MRTLPLLYILLLASSTTQNTSTTPRNVDYTSTSDDFRRSANGSLPTEAYNESKLIPTEAYNELSSVIPTMAYNESSDIPTKPYGKTIWIATESYNETNPRTTEKGADNSTDDVEVVIESRTDYVGYVVVPFFFLIGVCGNSLTIAVMLGRKFRYMTTSIILIAMAASDGIFTCINPFNREFLRNMIGYDIRALTNVGCSVFFIIFKTSKMSSSWFIVFVCFERFVAVLFPLKIKLICTKRITYIGVAVVFIAITAYNIAWDFATQVVDGNCVPNYATPDTAVMARAFLIVGTLFYSFLPVVILIVLTPAICVQLHRQTRLRRQLSSKRATRGDATAKTTTMLLGVTFAFIILVTPISIAHNVSFALGENFFESTSTGMVVVRDILQVMEQLNYSINFFMYVLCSRAFRRRVADILGCKRAPKPKAPDTSMYSLSTVA